MAPLAYNEASRLAARGSDLKSAHMSADSEIDSNRISRARELSDVKTQFSGSRINSTYGIHSKAIIVLAYAHWEGFYNDSVNYYIQRLVEAETRVADAGWLLLCGVLRSEFQSLRDRYHSPEAKLQFVDSLREISERGFANFDNTVVLSKSNLDFSQLRHNFKILGFDITPFQQHRLRIDNELVKWRHQVAHGDSPDLSAVDLDNHIAFTQQAMLLLADTFQSAISAVISER
ncbi:MAE_28990/MAE_18760 family HEPN-like nuclease [Salinisphaera sp. S4-8]|uniref:MAE_28990/MAE_18760 family HEPN-like nuclease n=1 Tax=Salinisphaera sp. S4-8 TaxID=633357 RepID=UPI00333E97B2